MDGGKDKLSNLAVACQQCNQHRGSQMNAAKQKAHVSKPSEIAKPRNKVTEPATIGMTAKQATNVTKSLTLEMIAPSTRSYGQFYGQLSLPFDEPSPKPAFKIRYRLAR